MKLLQIFRTKHAPSPVEVKGYYAARDNAQNAYFQQLYANVNGLISLPDWSVSSDREAFYKLYADKNSGNHAVFAVVNSLSRATAEVMQYAELLDKNDDVVENHWTEKLLKQPNDAQTMSEFITLWAVNLLTVGDAFTYGLVSAVNPQARKFQSMYIMPSYRVEIISGGMLSPIKGYQVTGGKVYHSGVPELNPNNVMMCKLANPSAETFYGLSPLVPVLKDAEIIDNGKKRTNGSIKNGGVNNIIFPQPDNSGMGLTAQQKDAFEKELNGRRHGNYNKVVNTPVGVARLGDTPADLSLLETSEASIQAICNVYSYPIDLLFGRSTFSNMGEAKKMRYELAIPYADYYLEKYSNWTGVAAEGLKWRINSDKIEALKPDPNTVINSMSNAGTTMNERREYLGYPPIKDEIGNKVTYPMNLSFGDEGQDAGSPFPETTPKPTQK